jgi:hypothetical protein
MADQRLELDDLSSAELAGLAREILAALASRGDHAAFAALLTITAHVGQCLGSTARSLATSGAWTQVADLSGTTKQAAWSRWHA